MDLGVIILAAGHGKRLGGQEQKIITNISGKSIISYLVDTIKKINPKKIVLVVGFKKEDVIKDLQNKNVEFVEQENLLGTGNAVLQTENALKNFNGALLIICGDIPFVSVKTLKNLIKMHRKNSASCTILTARFDNPAGYGRIKRYNSGEEVVRIVEDINANPQEKEIDEINTGIYLFDKKDLFQYLPFLKPDPVKKEYYLTDIIELFSVAGKKVVTYMTDKPEETMGINTPQDLKRAEEYSERRKSI